MVDVCYPTALTRVLIKFTTYTTGTYFIAKMHAINIHIENNSTETFTGLMTKKKLIELIIHAPT